jgi:CHAD domain-containing protein
VLKHVPEDGIHPQARTRLFDLREITRQFRQKHGFSLFSAASGPNNLETGLRSQNTVILRSDFAGRQINRLLRNLTAQVRQTLRSADADAVHDLRVAIRRFDQALLLFEPLLESKDVRKTRRKLKRVMGLAGNVRNCDIAAQLLAGRLNGTQPYLDEQRSDESRSLVAGLRSWIAGDYSSTLRNRLRIEPGSLAFDLNRMKKNYMRFGGKAAKSESPAALHRFRIAAKHYRYTLEILASLIGRVAEAEMKAIRTVQSRLGNVNDCETVRVMAADWPGSGKIDKFLKKRERQQMQKFRQEWKQYADTDRLATQSSSA